MNLTESDKQIITEFLKKYHEICEQYFKSGKCTGCPFDEQYECYGLGCDEMIKEHPDIAIKIISEWEKPKIKKYSLKYEAYGKVEAYSEAEALEKFSENPENYITVGSFSLRT